MDNNVRDDFEFEGIRKLPRKTYTEWFSLKAKDECLEGSQTSSFIFRRI